MSATWAASCCRLKRFSNCLNRDLLDLEVRENVQSQAEMMHFFNTDVPEPAFLTCMIIALRSE